MTSLDGSLPVDPGQITTIPCTTSGDMVDVMYTSSGTYDIRVRSPFGEEIHTGLTAGDIYSVTSTGASGAWRLSGITAEEEKELDELKKDLEAWKKKQRLNHFKELPKHIRQNIVDEACLKQMFEAMDSVKDSDFENHLRLEELECKSKGNGHWIAHRSPTGLYQTQHPQYTYYGIINEFSKDELIEAHADATIDEEVL